MESRCPQPQDPASALPTPTNALPSSTEAPRNFTKWYKVDSFLSFHGGVDGLKHKVVDEHTERTMHARNINCHREPLLFFPYVSLPQSLRNGRPPKVALQEILNVLQSQGLYAEGTEGQRRWMYEETFPGKTCEYAVAQFFQAIQEAAFDWAEVADSHSNLWRDHSLRLIENLRKPDVILVPINKSLIAFKDVLTYCELKQSFSGKSQTEALKQLTEIAGYASAGQLNRRFYIASSLCDRKLTLAAFVRGSTVISEPLDIDASPLIFLSVVLGLSLTSAAWCGFDESLVRGPSNNSFHLRHGKLLSKFQRINLGDVLLHAATSMHGKGTKVPLCEVWERLGAPSKTYPIKMCWMMVSLEDQLLNDIDIAKLMKDRAPDFPILTGLQKRIFGKEDEYKIFAGCLKCRTDEDPTWDYVNFWPGITIVLPDECAERTAPCPLPYPGLWKTGYYPDDYQPPMLPDTTRHILERFDVPVRIDGQRVDDKWRPQDEDAVYTLPELLGENRQLIWVLYRSCGTSLVWFSCRRELINGLLGGLAGHFNALQLKIQHCDVGDPNLMFKVEDASPEAVVPDWPQDEESYPKRPGMLGDWGYAADLAGDRTVRRITGTFPYMATAFLEPGTTVSSHTVCHDLESFFWVLWIMCVNMNGPFYTRRRWKDEGSSSRKIPWPSLNSDTAATANSSVFADSGVSGTIPVSAATSGFTTTERAESPWTSITAPSPQIRTPFDAPDPESYPSQLQSLALPLQRQSTGTYRESPNEEPDIRDAITRLPKDEEKPEKHAPPIWATPGRHNLNTRDVFYSKKTMTEDNFVACISPYFREIPAIVEGLRTLHRHFLQGEGGTITHERFCEILKNMRDGIPAERDRTPDQDIKHARQRYNVLAEAGGSHGIAISVLDHQPQRRQQRSRKRGAEEHNDDPVPKKRTSKTTGV